MRTALVTGGAGFIGSWLVDRLASEGWRVVVIDDLRSSPIDLVALRVDWGPGKDIEVFTQDVLDFTQPPCFPDVIFHCAGPVGAVGVLPQAGTIIPSVVELARRVGRWATAHECPLVFVATSESYGVGGECHETSERRFAPGHSARMEYAIAKLAAETMLLNTKGLDVRIVRPFNVAGPRQSGIGGFVVPRFIAQAALGLPLTVYRPGTQVRAFTHVLDEVDGIIASFTNGHPGLVVNLGNPGNRTNILDLAKLVMSVVGSGELSVVDPRDLWGPSYVEAVDKYPAPSSRATSIGWHPSRDLARIVTDAYEYQNRPGMMTQLGAL